MKTLLIALTLAFSTAAMAKVPATEAFKNIVAAGEYQGTTGSEKCLVTVLTQVDSVTVSIKTATEFDVFALLNSSINYSVNEANGSIAATQSLKFPYYLQGGTKILNVKANDMNEVAFSISTILLDHRGNDASTYLDCTISL